MTVPDARQSNGWPSRSRWTTSRSVDANRRSGLRPPEPRLPRRWSRAASSATAVNSADWYRRPTSSQVVTVGKSNDSVASMMTTSGPPTRTKSENR